MFDYAEAAVDAAIAAGARYADARVMDRRHESMIARNGEVEGLTQEGSVGLGVRALIGSGWGFYAAPTSPMRPPAPRERRLPPSRAPAHRSRARTSSSPRSRCARTAGPTTWPRIRSTVPLAEKGDLLVGATRTMNDHGADVALASYDIWDTTKWLASSEGHRIDQHIVECGAQMDATANGECETQRRSYPGIRGQYGTRGWELVRELDLAGQRSPDRRGGARAADGAGVPEP